MTELKHISFVLNPVLEKMLCQYQDFLNQSVSLEPKEFTAYHNACKSVLGHISILLKLIQSECESDKEKETDLNMLLENAKKQTCHLEEDIYAEFD